MPECGRRTVPLLLEVPIRLSDYPDETGYPYLAEHAALARRQYDAQVAASCITWRHKLRASYRDAMAMPPDSQELYDALGVMLADVASWRAAMERRTDAVGRDGHGHA